MAMPDPATMAMIMQFMGPALKSLTGQEGQWDSTYNDNQLGFLDQMINQLKGQNSDITQNQNYGMGQDWLQSLFSDEGFFKNFEAPMQRQFQEETVPGLANRFAGMGSGGSLGSTAFRNQLGREGSNLHTNIAAMRGGMQQQGANQALQYAQQPTSNYLNMLQGALKPTKNVYQPPGF